MNEERKTVKISLKALYDAGIIHPQYGGVIIKRELENGNVQHELCRELTGETLVCENEECTIIDETDNFIILVSSTNRKRFYLRSGEFHLAAVGKEGTSQASPEKFSVKIPGGYLLVKEKGAEYAYPGVFISFSKDGKNSRNADLIACVEYDTSSEKIQEVFYQQDSNKPVHIRTWPDGRKQL